MSPTRSAFLDQKLRQLAWYGQRKPVFSEGNQVALLRGGRALFPALCEAIDQAKESVWLACYIVSQTGEAGHVLQALQRAARRGVDVRLVADGIGSRETPPSMWSELKSHGVQCVIYRPVIGVIRAIFKPGQWRRMHMKLCVVDDQTAFVGGINLLDDLFDINHGWADTPRLDYAVRVTGAAVEPIVHTTKAIWTRAAIGRDWRDDVVMWLGEQNRLGRLREWWHQTRLHMPPPRLQAEALMTGVTHRPMRCAFVLRDNILQRRTIERAFRSALTSARERVDIVTPYFYPGQGLRLALQQAAARGVQVRLLLQGKIDYAIAGLAARVLYEELQHHGIQIYEYQAAFLHAKVLCVDGHWASIGSSNLDPLSMLLNLEANVIVDDRTFAQTLLAELDKDFSAASVVAPPTPTTPAWRRGLARSFVAWCANLYLRMGGVRKRY